jgi:hypothetical protein
MYIHCKKSWQSSSTPASCDAGPRTNSAWCWKKFPAFLKTNLLQNLTFLELLCYKHINNDHRTSQMLNFFDNAGNVQKEAPPGLELEPSGFILLRSTHAPLYFFINCMWPTQQDRRICFTQKCVDTQLWLMTITEHSLHSLNVNCTPLLFFWPKIFDKYFGNRGRWGGGVLPCSMSNLFDIEQGLYIPMLTMIL